MKQARQWLAGTTALATLVFANAPSQAQFGAGLRSAAESYGLGQLVAAAKRADPDSPIPGMIEHILAGISLVKSPKDALINSTNAVYPGSLAASAIEQLITRHGPQIARMSYSERKVFIGDIYSDPSIIPESRAPLAPSRATLMCEELIQRSELRYCTTLVARIQQCSAVKNMDRREVQNCNEDLTYFYELMEYEGRTKLVREAGEVAGREIHSLYGWSPPSDELTPDGLPPGTGSAAGPGKIACPATAYPLLAQDSGKPTNLGFLEKKSGSAYEAGKITEGSDGSIPTHEAECKYRGPNGRITTVSVTWHARAGHYDPRDPALCYKGWNDLSPWLTEYRFAHRDRSIFVQISRLLEGNNRASDLFSSSERDAIARAMIEQALPTSFPCERPWER